MDEARNKLKELVEKGVLPMETAALMMDTINSADKIRAEALRPRSAPRPAVVLESATEEDTLTIPAAGTGRLKIDNKAGSVRLSGHAEANVLVSLKRTVSAATRAQAQTLLPFIEMRADRDGDALVITVKVDDELKGTSHRVELDLTIPYRLAVEAVAGGEMQLRGLRGGGKYTTLLGLQVAECEGKMQLRTRSGDATVEDANGELDLQVEGGSLTVRRLQGTAKLACLLGSVTLEEATGIFRVSVPSGDLDGSKLGGSMNIRIGSGHLRLQDAALQSLDATITNGSARVSASLARDSLLSVRAKNGDVHLTVPQQTCARVQMKVANGKNRCELPLIDQTQEGGEQQGMLNDVGGSITLVSDQGDVTLAAQQ